ncbi:AraC family transcriptional regulator [Pedobacter sp.]|uniref:AraC family transcriptional regulator n=1 Tax=Pedobacter sp. TaxID=1411316 RepID=UPI0031E37E47
MKICRVLANKNVVEYEKTAEQRLQILADDYQIKIVFNGRQEVLIGTRKFSIFPDCLAIIPPGCSCECLIEADVPVQTLSITLNAHFIEAFLRLQYPFQKQLVCGETLFDLPEASVIPMNSDMRQNFRHLLNRTVAVDTHDALLNEYISQFLLDYVSGHHNRFRLERKRLSFARPATKADISRRLLLAKEYISNNYNQKFHLAEVANSCYLSENHLLRTFKEMFGLTPYQHLALVRLNRAKNYLEQGGYTVNEIVILVGFESVSTFIKLFRLTFALTPLQYRKHFQKMYAD